MNIERYKSNTDLAVDAASMTLSQKLGGALGGVASGFELAQGAMALFGVEGENVQAALLKVQSAMALSQGIQGLKEAKTSFIALGNSAANALKGIRTGIAATGIGLLLVAVGTLVAYWDDIKEAVSGVSDEQAELNKKTEANLKAAEEKVSALDKQDNILKLQGKSEKQILELKIKELDATIAIAETNLANQKATKKAQVEAAKRNHDILVGIISFMSIPLELLLKSVDKVASFIGKETGLSDWYKGIKESGANLLFDPDATAKEGDEAIKAAEEKLLDLKNQRAGYIIAIRNIEQQGAQNRVNTERGAAQESIDLTRQRIDKEIELMADGYDKERRLLEEKAKREKEDLAESIKGKTYDAKEYAKTQKLIEDNLKKDLKELNSKYFDGELEARGFSIEALKNDKIKELEVEVEANEEKARIQKEYDEKEKERIKQLNQDKLQLAKDGLQLVSDLASLFGQEDEKKAKLAFQVDKAAKISSATIAGYEAVLEAYKTGQKSPLTAVFPAYPYIQAGLAGAFAAVNIAKIGKAKFQSSGGGGGSMSPAGAGGGAAPMTANFSTIGSSGINQLAQLQQTPTQAYVVSGEVTSAQALDRNRVQNATL